MTPIDPMQGQFSRVVGHFYIIIILYIKVTFLFLEKTVKAVAFLFDKKYKIFKWHRPGVVTPAHFFVHAPTHPSVIIQGPSHFVSLEASNGPALQLL